jgi:hypothetical protein
MMGCGTLKVRSRPAIDCRHRMNWRSDSLPRVRMAMRWAMAAFYLAAGVVHLLAPDRFLPIVPDFVLFITPRKRLASVGAFADDHSVLQQPQLFAGLETTLTTQSMASWRRSLSRFLSSLRFVADAAGRVQRSGARPDILKI